VPEPGPDEVLIAVGACAVNATDVNTRTGWYGTGEANGGWGGPIAFPRIQGADVCGRVIACGDSTSTGLLGERCLVDPWLRDPEQPDDLARCGYLGSERDGGYAEYVTVPARNVHPVRSTLSDVELARSRRPPEPPRTCCSAWTFSRAKRFSSPGRPAE